MAPQLDPPSCLIPASWLLPGFAPLVVAVTGKSLEWVVLQLAPPSWLTPAIFVAT
jgi:hypothetical protein